MRVFHVLAPLSAASVSATNCVGSSRNLPADQCDAWMKFHSDTGGMAPQAPGGGLNYWISGGTPTCYGQLYNTDPCQCRGQGGQYSTCNEPGGGQPGGTAITQMYVRAPARRCPAQS